MGAKQIKRCVNCRFSFSSGKMKAHRCEECLVSPMHSNWRSNRGRPTGSKSKPGSKKTGSIPKPSGELMCFPVIPIKAKDLEAYGGIETLKEDVKQMVNEKIKQ